MSLKTAVTFVLLAAALCWLYGRRLSDAPIYISPDEAIIAIDTHALATTGRDLGGERLPLYFKIQMPGEERSGWFTPAIFYFSALFLRVLPFNEWSVRLPTVVIGLTDILLTYLIARRIFDTTTLALLAAGLLALTPAHFLLSRYDLDYLYPLPFVLGWLLWLTWFVERKKPLILFFATACLGLGFFSYISSVLMMPIYLLLTLLVVSQEDRFARLTLVAIAGFCLALLPLVPWLVHHPTAFGDTAQRYGLYDAHRLNVLQGFREYLSYPNLDRLASLYWNFFNPSFLFFSGDRQMMFSTRAVGVFVLPIALLLPLGMFEAFRRRRNAIDLLVLAGFVTAPLAAVIVPESAEIIRAVAMLPFGVLLATFGVQWLWRAQIVERGRAVLLPVSIALFSVTLAYALKTIALESRLSATTMGLLIASLGLFAIGRTANRTRQGRALALCLLALIPILFVRFYLDYFSDYRVRTSIWLGGNLRGALETLIAREREDHAPFVYFSRIRSTAGLLDTRNRWMDAYWRFYLIKQRREDLLARTVNIDTTDVSWMPSRSLVLANVGDQVTGSLVGGGQLKQVALIPEMDGSSFFVILQRP